VLTDRLEYPFLAGYLAMRIRELECDLLHATSLLHEDSLTGLLNRRGFQQACTLLSAGASGHGAAIACAMIDLDNFKTINDRHGHATGDQALCQFAEVLRMNLPKCISPDKGRWRITSAQEKPAQTYVKYRVHMLPAKTRLATNSTDGECLMSYLIAPRGAK
jgi:hypothetical protein